MIKPKYIAIAAVTIDGKIAKGPNHISDWTSKEDKIFMRALLDKCDVVVVGNNTYKTAIKPLSKRNCIVFTSKVPSVPFSPGEGRCPECIRGTEGSKPRHCHAVSNLLYINPAKSNFKKLIKTLNYKNIAILGGAQTYSWFLENNLLDELYLTIEPVVFGEGINLFSSNKMFNNKFILRSVKKLNQKGSLLLHYFSLAKKN